MLSQVTRPFKNQMAVSHKPPLVQIAVKTGTSVISLWIWRSKHISSLKARSRLRPSEIAAALLYIMFPPHTTASTEGSNTSDEKELLSTTPPVYTRNPYQYQPLPQYSIRLLRLLPEDDKSKPVRCELLEFRLDQNDQQPSLYEALSYTWGSSDEKCTIDIQNNTVAITANLHKALVQLRHYSLPRVLWVDAICIDQNNNTEKETQIPLMYSIYTRASSVLVWLGETPKGDDQAFDHLCVIASKRAADPGHVEKRMSEGIYKLLQHNWFQRIWVCNSNP